MGLLQTTGSYEHSVSQSSIRLLGSNEYIFEATGGGLFLQSSTESLRTLSLLQYLSGKFISSSPSPQFNVVYRDEFVIARLQHCLGRGGVPILVMSFGIVSKIPCEHIFVLSDPGVPRTFVMDCSLQLF